VLYRLRITNSRLRVDVVVFTILVVVLLLHCLVNLLLKQLLLGLVGLRLLLLTLDHVKGLQSVVVFYSILFVNLSENVD
jgi:hypothetical protein